MGPFDPPKESSPFDGPLGGSNGNGMSSPTPPGGSPPPQDRTDPGGNSPAPDPLPPSAPFPGTASTGNGMAPAAPGDAAETPNGMGEGDLPQASLPSISMDLRNPMQSSADLEWSVPTYEVADAEGDHYALESRAETMNVMAYGDATRRGEIDYLRTGKGERFIDSVAGEEQTDVEGLLIERIGRGSRMVAAKSETTVRGRMSITAGGWKGNWMSGEDSILLGGALTDTWTGGLMIVSAMSDDMAIGAGARLSGPVDMWLNQLTGMEERPGTAAADGIMIDLAGTLFEREYGAGVHKAALAVFSGTVYQTQRQGFWPMMRVAVGVRNLLPGAGTAASEQAPPAPPPLPPPGAEAALLATGAVGGAAGGLRSGDTLPDAMRAARAAEDLEEVSNLRHMDNTALQLDELSTVARANNVEAPNGMGAANDLPPASPPPPAWESPMSAEQLQAAVLRPGVDAEDALRRVDELIADRLARIAAATPEQIDQINTMMAQKLQEIAGAGGEVYRAEDILGQVDKGGSSFIGMRRGESVPVTWPGTPLVGDEARQAQLYAELDALATIKRALEESQDPARALADALAELEALHGGVPTPDSAAFAQWQALTDAQVYLRGLSSVGAKAEMTVDLDFYMLVRSELVAGRDPRVAVQAALDGLEEGSDAQRYAQNVLDGLGRGGFNFDGQVPEGLDTSALRDHWTELASQLDAAARQLDDGTEEGWERARALRDVSGQLSLARMNMMSGYDPRDALETLAKQLEARTFMDGADGAGEASILRAAIAEYATLLDDFTSGAAAASGLDEGLSPTAAAGVGRVGDTLTDPSPPYPGLPDEFTPGEDLRLTIEPPSYSEAFPGGVPDEIRLLLDTQPEQLGGGAEEGATLGSRLETRVAAEGAATPMQPEMDEFGTRWVRVEEGELPVPQTFERVVVLDGTHVPVPDNYETVRLTEDPGTQTVTVSSDTTAVVESMAVRPAPQSTDWGSTFDALNDDYMHYRRDSTWRVMAEYENSIEVLRDDLRRAITDFGGDASQYTSETPVAQLYNRVQELLGQADNADDARRIQEFLDGFNSRTYDVYSDFVQRADEFEGVRTGASFPLDKHIDQDALRDWLDKRFTDAMATADPANQASRDEVAFWQQAHVAVKEGRNPLQDLGDQIAYLLGKIDPNVPIEELPENQQVIARQIQNFRIQQQELIDILGDPAFHRSAATMGDDTYAPVHFVRPELGDPPPVGTGVIQTQIFDPEAVQEPTQLSGGIDAASGNYAANQEAINDRIGGNDFAQVPQEQPAGLEPSRPQPVEQAQPQGPRGILRNADAGGGPVGLENSRIVNRGPDGENVPDEIMELWTQRMLTESNEEAARRQGDFANYMDQMAGLRTPTQQMEDGVSLNPYAASRVEAANQVWDTQRGLELSPPSEWERMPDTDGTRSWDHRGWQLPPTDRPRMRKSVRFGDAEVLTVAADAEDVRKIQNQWRDLDNGNAIMPWWTGSGINRTTDPLNTGEAVRHVPTPRLPTDRKCYPSSWRASRQPGFGRLADAPGAFPFNAREQMITELMQGKRVDASHIDLLQGGLNDAVRAERVQHKEWVKMTALIRHLKYGVVLGDSRPYARALDSRTLQIMLDMADAASAVV